MRMYELANEYDARGRHLPNTTRKNQGGTQFRSARAAATEHYPTAFRERGAADALAPDWPLCGGTDPSSLAPEQAAALPTTEEFASMHRHADFLRQHASEIATARAANNTNSAPDSDSDPETGQPPAELTVAKVIDLERIYGIDRIPITLDVSWDIDDGLQTVTKTFYAPFTKVDREEDYRRAWEVFSERYGHGE